jgi:Transglycosylase SLT domain
MERAVSFMEEASRRFAIPASWIRAVMQAESGGDPRALSAQGAMGLMQIMPGTWAELRVRYGLGADPYDPRDNITAGVAYLRELHDRFGAPGFLAAYNAGPARYAEHLASGRPLPAETVSYMAVVASLMDISVGNRAAVDVSAPPPWTSSPLFVVRSNVGGSASIPSINASAPRLPLSQMAKADEAFRPPAEGLFAVKPHRKGSR